MKGEAVGERAAARASAGGLPADGNAAPGTATATAPAARDGAAVDGRRIGLGILAGLLVLAADQASKWWILEVLDLPARGQVVVLPFLNLTMVWNQGVTFGLLSQDNDWGPWLLSAVALAVVAALGVWLRRAESGWTAAALGAVAGGAVGNVIDRMRFGAVVDFLHAHAWGWSWYVFNVADAAIVCGVGILVFESLFARRS